MGAGVFFHVTELAINFPAEGLTFRKSRWDQKISALSEKTLKCTFIVHSCPMLGYDSKKDVFLLTKRRKLFDKGYIGFAFATGSSVNGRTLEISIEAFCTP
jgi:hypothetical protein